MDNRYIVKANEIATSDGVSKTHFLNESVKRTNKSPGDLTGLKLPQFAGAGSLFKPLFAVTFVSTN